MKRFTLAICLAVFLALSVAPLSMGADLPKKKQTELGLYVTSQQAYQMWSKSKGSVVIVDCRTPEEYVFVGHAPMAYNIPSKFMAYDFNAKKKSMVMKENPKFIEMIKAKFKPDQTLLLMCRSGGRSAASINKLVAAGFKKVYNITDGFEGDKVKDANSYFNGKRMVNGWKNSGAPWTYHLDGKLVYKTGTK